MSVSLCQFEWPQASKVVDLVQEFQWILKAYFAAKEQEENQKKKHSALLQDLGKSFFIVIYIQVSCVYVYVCRVLAI